MVWDMLDEHRVREHHFLDALEGWPSKYLKVIISRVDCPGVLECAVRFNLHEGLTLAI